jgi:hypothetical protein
VTHPLFTLGVSFCHTAKRPMELSTRRNRSSSSSRSTEQCVSGLGSPPAASSLADLKDKMTIEQQSAGREDLSPVTMGVSARVMMIHNVVSVRSSPAQQPCFYKASFPVWLPLPPVCSLKTILVDLVVWKPKIAERWALSLSLTAVLATWQLLMLWCSVRCAWNDNCGVVVILMIWL